MPVKIFGVFLTMLITSPSFAQTGEIPKGFISIFNGKDLTGWHISRTTHQGTTPDVHVQNKEIVMQQHPYGQGGILLSDKKYKDYELYLEVKVDSFCNGGIFLRSTESGQAYQVELAEPGGTGNLLGEMLRVSKTAEAKEKAKAWKPNEWNSFRIHMTGEVPTLTLWMNGQLMWEVTEPVNDFIAGATEGMIGLQAHWSAVYSAAAKAFDMSASWRPGASHRFRNIAIKELNQKQAASKSVNNKITFEGYTNSRAPLRENPYLELPLGAIKPLGWLKEMLLTQKNGATANLDKLYPLVMNNRNGWLGGDGDQWERGPYWIDGLLPLAYILDDKESIQKTKPWVEWAISSQQPDGYFGPSKDYGPEPGLQRNNSRDWWPKMVMLKILKQYYSATGDKRVIDLMTNYFKYQLKELPHNPLDHWTFWARYRGGDNLMIVYWLYNITGDKFLLELGDLLHKQTFDYTNAFLNTDMLSRQGSIHCVNLAQGMKEPVIYYQHHQEQRYLDATKKGFEDIKKYDGLAHGLYGGDEALHGNNPTQGSELCSAVEMMFTLENLLSITANISYADHLEKIAFNALPAQVTDDFLNRQYFQQANQVMLTRQIRNFDVNHGGTDVCYGLLTGYPCCTSNMHQGWPKFTQNLWYATPDKGLAALVYSPSEVKAYVANGSQVSFKEETNYPFEETIKFTFSTGDVKPVTFPFHLRVPEWCRQATLKINGKTDQESGGNKILIINREWKSGDVVELHLSMHVFKNTWYENSISIERGPLVYALKMEEEMKKVVNEKDPVNFGDTYYEVYPKSPWNYGLVNVPADKMEEAFTVSQSAPISSYPWNPQSAPISIKAKARRIPSWQIYNGMAGPIPYSITYGLETEKDVEEVTLIPYGCTNLRISQFPVVGRR